MLRYKFYNPILMTMYRYLFCGTAGARRSTFKMGSTTRRNDERESTVSRSDH